MGKLGVLDGGEGARGDSVGNALKLSQEIGNVAVCHVLGIVLDRDFSDPERNAARPRSDSVSGASHFRRRVAVDGEVKDVVGVIGVAATGDVDVIRESAAQEFIEGSILHLLRASVRVFTPRLLAIFECH